MVIGLWELELVKKPKTTQIIIPFTWQFWISIYQMVMDFNFVNG